MPLALLPSSLISGHHARRVGGAHEARGLGPRVADQPAWRVLRHTAGAAYDDEAALRAHHQYRFGGGRERQRGPGKLRDVEGGADRPDQGAGAGDGGARDYGERHRAGLHRHRYDGGADGRAERETVGASTVAAAGAAGGDRGSSAFFGQRRGGVYHGARAERQRRHVYVVEAM